ncbi:MAG: anthranilate synthase component II [Salibacteraceae bacterium]
MRLLVIDNYDSFTYNLVHYLEPLVAHCTVWRNDAVDLEEVARFDALVLSPGPGLPMHAGQLLDVLAHWSASKPMLGVCLGMQALVEHFGGSLYNLSQVAHGIATEIEQEAFDPMYSGLPNRLAVGRYHSWVAQADQLPEVFEVTARSAEGLIMSVRHRSLPLWGVQ